MVLFTRLAAIPTASAAVWATRSRAASLSRPSISRGTVPAGARARRRRPGGSVLPRRTLRRRPSSRSASSSPGSAAIFAFDRGRLRGGRLLISAAFTRSLRICLPRSTGTWRRGTQEVNKGTGKQREIEELRDHLENRAAVPAFGGVPPASAWPDQPRCTAAPCAWSQIPFSRPPRRRPQVLKPAPRAGRRREVALLRPYSLPRTRAICCRAPRRPCRALAWACLGVAPAALPARRKLRVHLRLRLAISSTRWPSAAFRRSSICL